MIPADNFDDLTEGQKACLRLVLDHHTSKEISRILGISPFTVDQRLDAARLKLNADSRKSAAKMLAAFENTVPEPLVYQPQPVENVDVVDKHSKSTNLVGRIMSRFASFVSVPPLGGVRHRLSVRETLVQSLNIAFFGTLIIAIIIIILAGIMDLLA